jgi:hypothetical protein
MNLNRIFIVAWFTIFILNVHNSHAQQETPYTDWAKKDYPKAQENINNMVTKIWGSDNAAQTNYLIELHCLSFYNIIVYMSGDQAKWDILEKSMVKWSQYKGADRAEMDFWDWPDTNWMKVEYEYKLLIEKAKTANQENPK